MIIVILVLGVVIFVQSILLAKAHNRMDRIYNQMVEQEKRYVEKPLSFEREE